MVSVSTVGYYLVHPSELRAIIQWKTWHDAVHTRDESKETATEKRCFEFLRKTSRSFSAVIMELHPELLLPVCVFYLVLRGLDTVEDDTSIPIKVQEPLLRGFKDKLEIDGWTFDGNRPEEKDRDLLLEFDNVIAEFKNIKPAYQAIIKDIADRMGNGMADYCVKADMGDDKVDTIADYDLYCYYVAGLVGEGLTRLFVEAGFARPQLLERPELFKSMGLFLQKTNIIRDVREDQDDNRRFWPKGIWSKHVSRWEDLFNPEYTDEALNCNSEMIHNALEHADDCVFYLAGLTEQSVFNFCAIPQTMAIATLEACFRNPVMFQRNVKITKGEACRLMSQSTQNVRLVCDLFRQYSRLIHKKNNAKDPSFLFISVACGKVEKFIESIFPSQKLEDAQRRIQHMKPEEEEARDKERNEIFWDTIYLLVPLLILMLFMSAIMFGVAWYFGARFDLAWQEVRKGNVAPPNPGAQFPQPQPNQQQLRHGEL